ILDHVVLDGDVVERGGCSVRRIDLEYDSARALRGVPSSLECNPGRDVVCGRAVDPVDLLGDVVDGAVADHRVMQDAGVSPEDRDAAIVAWPTLVVGKLEVVDLPIRLIDETQGLEIARVRGGMSLR